jgi:hypothetical protein
MKRYKLCDSFEDLNNTHQTGGGKKKKRNPFKYKEYNNITISQLNNLVDKNTYMEEHKNNCDPNLYTPSILPAVERLIVLGDIHGDYNLFIELLTKAKVIKVSGNQITWIGGNTHVVQVGDQIDRCRPIGNMGCQNPLTTYEDEASDIKILELANYLKLQAKTKGGDFISLLGNHELMNVMGQMSYVSHQNIQEFNNYKNDKNLVFKNPIEARKYAFLPGNQYGNLLGCSRLASVVIGSHLFVHAGIVDGIINELQMNKSSDLETINLAISKWLLGFLDRKHVEHIINASRYSIFWTRILGTIPQNVDYNDPICHNNIKKVLELFKIGSIIVGHTPQSFLFNDKINATCSGKVWRVDNGSSAAFHKFDNQFMRQGKITDARKPMVLEILNDKIYNVIS